MKSVDKLRHLAKEMGWASVAELADEIEQEAGGQNITGNGELLPCPFCGGEAEIVERGLLFIARCADGWCIGGGVSSTYTDAESAAKAWNTRAAMSYEDALILLDELGLSEQTCKQEERGWGTEGDHARVWLTCGHDCMVPTVQDLPNYCPSCGAHVIKSDQYL